MKVPFKKPGHEWRTLKDMRKLTNSRWSRLGTMIYPPGHPMREYKDKKKALKASRASLCK